jgi:hypothetical protein
MKTPHFLALTLLLTIVAKGATYVTVNWSNNVTNGIKLCDIAGTPLTAGTSAGRDGAVLQLGYYTGATQSSPFSGNWIPLTGPGSSPLFSTTIGDTLLDIDGRFSISTSFKSDYPNVPPPGTPLAIRFYDGTSLATANYFNSVSDTDGTWNWITSDPEATMILRIKVSSATQVWEGGSGSAFRTTIPVPEPSGLWLAAGSAWLVFRRRRITSPAIR